MSSPALLLSLPYVTRPAIPAVRRNCLAGWIDAAYISLNGGQAPADRRRK